MFWNLLVHIASPIIGKLVADLVRKMNIPDWLVKPLASVVAGLADGLGQLVVGGKIDPGMASAIGLVSVAVNEFGNDLKVKKGNGGNFPGGISNVWMALLIAGSLLFSASLTFGQTGDVVKATSPKTGFGDVLLTLSSFVKDNGAIHSGYGWCPGDGAMGVLLLQELDFNEFHVRHTAVRYGINHATFFPQTAGNQTNRELLGASLSFQWFKTPPWVESVLKPSILGVVLPVNLSELEAGVCCDYPPDKLIAWNMDPKLIVVGVYGGFKF